MGCQTSTLDWLVVDSGIFWVIIVTQFFRYLFSRDTLYRRSKKALKQAFPPDGLAFEPSLSMKLGNRSISLTRTSYIVRFEVQEVVQKILRISKLSLYEKLCFRHGIRSLRGFKEDAETSLFTVFVSSIFTLSYWPAFIYQQNYIIRIPDLKESFYA